MGDDWGSGVKANAPTLTVWENLHRQKIGNAKDFGGGAPTRPDCVICGEPCVIGGIRLDCSHLFHYDCFSKLTQEVISRGGRSAKCPLCRTITKTKNPRVASLRKSPKARRGLPRVNKASSSSNAGLRAGGKDSKSGPATNRWEIYKIQNEEKVNKEWRKEYGRKYPNRKPTVTSRKQQIGERGMNDNRPQGTRVKFIKPQSKYVAHHTNYERSLVPKTGKLDLKSSTIKPNKIDRDLLAEMRKNSTRRMAQVRRIAGGRKEIHIPHAARPSDPWRNCREDPDIKLMKL